VGHGRLAASDDQVSASICVNFSPSGGAVLELRRTDLHQRGEQPMDFGIRNKTRHSPLRCAQGNERDR
jgi:hypothetical protein